MCVRAQSRKFSKLLFIWSLFVIAGSVCLIIAGFSSRFWLVHSAQKQQSEFTVRLGLFEGCTTVRRGGVTLVDRCESLPEPLATRSRNVFGILLASLLAHALALCSLLYLAWPCYRLCCDCIGSRSGVRELYMCLASVVVAIALDAAAVAYYAARTSDLDKDLRRQAQAVNSKSNGGYRQSFICVVVSGGVKLLLLIFIGLRQGRAWWRRRRWAERAALERGKNAALAVLAKTGLAGDMPRVGAYDRRRAEQPGTAWSSADATGASYSATADTTDVPDSAASDEASNETSKTTTFLDSCDES